MIGARHHRAMAVFFDGSDDACVVGGHDHLAAIGATRTIGHMDDQRPAGDIGQRFVRQSRGAKTGRYEYEGVHWDSAGHPRRGGNTSH